MEKYYSKGRSPFFYYSTYDPGITNGDARAIVRPRDKDSASMASGKRGEEGKAIASETERKEEGDRATYLPQLICI